MSWKELYRFGPMNLTDNWARLEALAQARKYLQMIGVDRAEIEQVINHEKQHLFAFDDFTHNSGKKMRLVVETDPTHGKRLAVVPNRKHARNDIRRSLSAVEHPSEGDLEYGRIRRFRKNYKK